MIKMAKDVKVGEIIRPWIDERTMQRTKKQYKVTGEPVYATHPAFSHYVTIPVLTMKGQVDEVFIFCEEDVEVVAKTK